MPSIAATHAADHADTKALLLAMLADFGGLNGSATWNAASIADGDMESKDITVEGAVIGDFVVASMGVDVTDLVVSAQVTAADTVTVTLANNTGGAVDLASTTVRVRVFPKTLTVTA